MVIKNSLSCALVFLLSLTLFSSVLLLTPSASADTSVVDDVSIMVQVSCTLTSVGNNSHNATINPGTYVDNIGTTTLKVFCNDNGGFAIYAIGFTGDVYTGTDHTKLIGASTNQKISTGTATGSNTNDPSNWAMKLTKVLNQSGENPVAYNPDNLTITNGYGSYSAVPDNYTKVASYSSTTDFTLGAKLETTYAAFMTSTQPADTYSGKVKYTLVHPSSNVPNEAHTCDSSTICYWPNAGNTVTDTMGDQTLDAETTLWASNFKRPGYGFVGWSDKYDWELNANDVSGNGTRANDGYHIYGPNQTLTLNTSDYSGTNGGLSLYAVWAPSAGTIQGWTCPNNTTMPIGTVTALTDTRDNDTYAVAKLADGNCWMIENLRLDYNANITTANTQSNNGAFGGVFSGLAQPETANFSNSTTANNLYKSDGSGDIKGVNGATLSDIGTTNSPGYRFPRYRNDNTNTDSTINANVNVANMTGTGQNVYSYGNYYTWAAAMANTSFYNTTTVDANGFTPSEAAGTSLCPTGWKLPYGKSSGKGATSGGFRNLNYIINNNSNVTDSTASKNLRTYPNNFLYSGLANTSSVGGRGGSGGYWSSTEYISIYSYFLYLNSSSVEPGTYSTDKYYGYSIRCLVGS